MGHWRRGIGYQRDPGCLHIQCAARLRLELVRFGGDEFLIVLPEEGVEGASILVQRIQNRLTGTIQISAGLAEYHPELASVHEMLQVADRQLYMMKRRDRMNSNRLNVYSVVAESPSGERFVRRLTAEAYRTIVAATNFKQRTRKMMEYYHADRLHYAVVGTPNRLEYDQGFFVKGGDGLADVKPIAHLYKTQVYALADALGVPSGITSRTPTTDTYSLPQTQEEFYFSLPTKTMDAMLHAHDRGLDPATAAAELGFSIDQVERSFREIEQKRATTRYLHLAPVLIEPVPGVTANDEDVL